MWLFVRTDVANTAACLPRVEVGRFPVDRILPRNAGGKTELDNLALACPHWNGQTWCLRLLEVSILTLVATRACAMWRRSRLSLLSGRGPVPETT